VTDADDDRGIRFARENGKRLSGLVQMLRQSLDDEAKRSGGSLTMDQVDTICHSLEIDNAVLESFVYDVVDGFLEWDGGGDPKKEEENVIVSLLTHRLSKVLVAGWDLQAFPEKIPDFSVPVIIQAFEGLVGALFFEELEEKLTGIYAEVKRVMAEGHNPSEVLFPRVQTGKKKKEETPWDNFCNHPETVRAMLSLVVRLSARYKNYERCKEWTIDFINVYVHPLILEHASQAELSWSFEESHFIRLMHAVTAEFRTVFKDASKRQFLSEELDDGEIELVRGLNKNITKDFKILRTT